MLRFNTSQTAGLAGLEWYSSTLLTTLRPPFVCDAPPLGRDRRADRLAAKFTGYQYGGRPLGLTYVKYTNANGGDAMEGTETTGGITQDQIM